MISMNKDMVAKYEAWLEFSPETQSEREAVKRLICETDLDGERLDEMARYGRILEHLHQAKKRRWRKQYGLSMTILKALEIKDKVNDMWSESERYDERGRQ